MRKDGYWAGAFYARTTAGRRKWVVVYGKTLQEARDKLLKAMQQARAGIPVPDQAWRLDLYLEYWLENIVKRNRRPATYNLYEMIVRLYLIPGLGNRRLTSLSVSVVQDFLNQRLEKGDSVRKVQVIRTVLSAALIRAMREEILPRNVARLVELPESKRATIHPWSATEARQFLGAAKDDSLYAASVVLIFSGLRPTAWRGAWPALGGHRFRRRDDPDSPASAAHPWPARPPAARRRSPGAQAPG